MTKKRGPSSGEEGKSNRSKIIKRSKEDDGGDASLMGNYSGAALMDLSSLQELYHQFISYDGDCNPLSSSAGFGRQKQQRMAVDQGWIRTQVGPQLFSTIALSRTKHTQQQIQWLCQLWALLLSFEGQSGRLTAGTNRYLQRLQQKQQDVDDEAETTTEKPQHILHQQNPTPLRTIFQTLCYDNEHDDDDDTQEDNKTRRLVRFTTVCHCITLLGNSDPHKTVWECAVGQDNGDRGPQKTSRSDDRDTVVILGRVLLEFIPKHCRDLIERQLQLHNPSLVVALRLNQNSGEKQQREATRDADGQGSPQRASATPPFLIVIMRTILKCLESSESSPNPETPNNMEEQEEGVHADDDGAGQTNLRRTSSSSNVEVIFLHRSLEMVIDILSAVSTLRTFLLLYLRTIHYSIRCRRALKEKDGQQNHDATPAAARKLTQQLLRRIQQLQQQSDDDDSMWILSAGTAAMTTNGGGGVDTASTRRMQYYRRASTFQKICHRYYGNTSKLDDVIFAGLGQLCGDHPDTATTTKGRNGANRKFLNQALVSLSLDELRDLLHKLRLIDCKPQTSNESDEKNEEDQKLQFLYKQRDFLLEVLQEHLQLPPATIATITTMDGKQRQELQPSSSHQQQQMSLFPTESLLWDFARIPPSHSRLLFPSQVLCLPKLYATQFLSYADYLWRNFTLLQLETASGIRSDLVNAIRRLRPMLGRRTHEEQDMYNDDGNEGDDDMMTGSKTTFAGWSRMALELQSSGSSSGLKVTKVDLPLLGQLHPRLVLAEFTIDLEPCGGAIRQEWDTLGEHDNVFLVAIDAHEAQGGSPPSVYELRANLGYHDKDDNGGSRREDDGPARFGGGGGHRRDWLVSDDDDPSFPARYGIQLVRGGTIVQIRDQEGTVLTDPAVRMQQQAPKPAGTQRVFSVALDPIQYYMDMQSGKKNLYSSMNLVVRRHGRENSFKALLETTQNVLIGTDSIANVLPMWLQSLLLGQGPVHAAHYQSTQMVSYANQTVGVSHDTFLDFGDTFLDETHLQQAFEIEDEQKTTILFTGTGQSRSGRTTTCGSSTPVDDKSSMDDGEDTRAGPRKNYKLRFSITEDDGGSKSLEIEAMSYKRLEHHVGNPIRFTSKQVEAIRSGLSCGLTLVVGPPGTGKTDVAVQIIASLYHSFPTQRTVIVTHSNAALNDVFEKVMARGDVPERHMIRLGGGERDLQTQSTHDFTKIGRVAYCLKRRAQLLEQVQQLSETLGLSGRAERGRDGSPSYTCESAAIFYQTKVLPKFAQFRKMVTTLDSELSEADVVKKHFPFYSNLISDGHAQGQPQQDQHLTSFEAVRKYDDKLHVMFEELVEYRPLEILRSQRQRSDYFLMKQARIVAMTSTHAAIARSHLISLGFQYDNLVVEESGQMTELDTFLPLLLQKGETDVASGNSSRLKRVCFLGDHNQLPPVIQSLSLARYSNMDQSMFARLIRMGVPKIELDQQGRTRPEIANLFNWRYNNLGNLEHVLASDRFTVANAGFVHTFQFINVENFQGKGETTPTAFFYQNMGEAEYVVALFQYMVLLGYPSRSISILTTYNGQKELISDILTQRCGEGTPLAGIRPQAVSTVDQYQGQQNDFILLSLVRTESIGHMRDVRRLVVALSRARYGLYVFGRFELFANHAELSPIISQFEKECQSRCLQLLLNETFPSERQTSSDNTAELPKDLLFDVEDVEHLGAMVHQMQDDLLQQLSSTTE